MAILFTRASSEYLEVASSPAPTSWPITISCWGQIDQTGINQALVFLGRTSAAGDAQALGVNSNNKLILRTARTGDISNFTDSASAIGATSLSTNTWYHLCGTNTNESTDVRRVYLNGVEDGSQTQTITPLTTSHFAIGMLRDSTPSNAWSGIIAEVGIWNVALSAAQVAILAAGYSPLLVRPQNLIAYLPLSGRNSPAIDLIGGRNLTWNNTPVYAEHPRIIYPKRQILIPDYHTAGGTSHAGSSLVWSQGLTSSTGKLLISSRSNVQGQNIVNSIPKLNIIGTSSILGQNILDSTCKLNITNNSNVLGQGLFRSTAQLTIKPLLSIQGEGYTTSTPYLSIKPTIQIYGESSIDSIGQLNINAIKDLKGQCITNSNGQLIMKPIQSLQGESGLSGLAKLLLSPSVIIHGDSLIFASALGAGVKLSECVILSNCRLNSQGQLVMHPTIDSFAEGSITSNPKLNSNTSASINSNILLYSFPSLSSKTSSNIKGESNLVTNGSLLIINNSILRGSSELYPRGVLSQRGDSIFLGESLLFSSGTIGLGGNIILSSQGSLFASSISNLGSAALIQLDSKIIADLIESGVEITTIREYILYITSLLEKDLNITTIKSFDATI